MDFSSENEPLEDIAVVLFPAKTMPSTNRFSIFQNGDHTCSPAESSVRPPGSDVAARLPEPVLASSHLTVELTASVLPASNVK